MDEEHCTKPSPPTHWRPLIQSCWKPLMALCISALAVNLNVRHFWPQGPLARYWSKLDAQKIDCPSCVVQTVVGYVVQFRNVCCIYQLNILIVISIDYLIQHEFTFLFCIPFLCTLWLH